MSLPHPQQISYAFIQPSSLPVLQSSSVNNSSLLENRDASSFTSPCDMHICGTCFTSFSDLKNFCEHKNQGCNSSVQLQTVNQVQTVAPTVGITANNLGSNVSVGVPHIVLQSNSGPQIYRLVLDSISGNVSAPSPVLSRSLFPLLHNSVTVTGSPSDYLATENTDTSANPEVSGNSVILTSVEGDSITTSSLLHLDEISDSWDKGIQISGLPSTKELKSSSDSDSSHIVNHSNHEKSDNNIQTDEADVATFLATQLGSQTSPTKIEERSINGIKASDILLQYAPPSSQAGVVQLESQNFHSYALPSAEQGFTAFATQNLSHVTVVLPSSQDSLPNSNSVTPCISKSLSCDNLPSYQPDAKVRVKVHKKLHECSLCDFKSCHKKDLARHKLTHTGEKPFKCNECSSVFSRRDKLTLHLRIHSQEKPYACSEPGCNYKCKDSGSLTKHKRIHSDERPYNADRFQHIRAIIRGSIFCLMMIQVAEMSRHKEIYARCQMCSYKSRDTSQLTVHLRTHTGDTPFSCPFVECPSAFKTASDLKRHIRLHTGEKPYKCDLCDYACSIKSNLNKHYKFNHSGVNKFSCRVKQCKFIGKDKVELKDHEKQHSFQCTLCSHFSATDEGLKSHYINVHSKEILQCKRCSFTCKTTKNLQHHVRAMHSSNSMQNGRGGRLNRKPICNRPFKCECGSSFVREESFRVHKRQHERQKINCISQATSDLNDKGTTPNCTILEGSSVNNCSANYTFTIDGITVLGNPKLSSSSPPLEKIELSIEKCYS